MTLKDTPEDEAFFYAVEGNVLAQSGLSYRLTTPKNKATSQEYKKDLLEALLGVVVCLKPDDDDTTKPTTTSTTIHRRRRQVVPLGPAPRLLLTIDIAQAHWGRGYGGEAIEWALGYAFRMANLHRVTLNAFSYNERALRLYERLGFVREARLREDVWFNGGWHDSISFGMLEEEWRARQEGAEGKWGE
ncbi:acyl-CoA N-acyltransferase [Apiospora hydei]|uniref:Acyl-CoA N-acyltransferase n=1 Tax=Apiospora hydei TaxID=1337664 RepID=A0ABR1V782_9PEZI